MQTEKWCPAGGVVTELHKVSNYYNSFFLNIFINLVVTFKPKFLKIQNVFFVIMKYLHKVNFKVDQSNSCIWETLNLLTCADRSIKTKKSNKI